MRTDHIQQHIEQQYELKKSIKYFAEKLNENGVENIKTIRDLLKEEWQEFKLNHRALNVAINTLRKSKKTEIMQRSYFKRKHFDTVQKIYTDALEKANTLIASNSTPVRETSTSRSSTSTGESNRVIHHAFRLPQLDFPKFNGSVLEWLPFRTVFEKMVVDNPAVDTIFKAHYLKAAMTGSASHFLNKTIITEENFKVTWEQLTDFYNNERVILYEALYSATTMKKMTNESAVELELLYSTVKRIRNTFELLKRSMPGIDDFLVYFTTQCFDPETLKAWDRHLRDTKEPPAWDKLASFMVSRFHTLKYYECSSSPKTTSSSSSSVKVHHVGATFSNSIRARSSPSCVICTDNHFLSRCPQYLNKTTQQREEIVTKHNRCYNCLGSHSSNFCISTNRCRKCGKKHHTTLHFCFFQTLPIKII